MPSEILGTHLYGVGRGRMKPGVPLQDATGGTREAALTVE